MSLSFKIYNMPRGGSRAATASKMECFVIIVNGWKPLTIITKQSILDVTAALDPPLMPIPYLQIFHGFFKVLELQYFKLPRMSSL